MSGVRRISALVVIGALSFVLAFRHRERPRSAAKTATAASPEAETDSARLAALAISPGPELVAYVMVSSRCGSCRRPETKAALVALRDSLRHNNAAAFSSVHIVAVAINTDLREGLAYLDSIGFEHFDQVSVGDGWQNQHVVRLIWRDHVAEPEAPQVILVTRAMNARIDPVELTFTPDSVIGAVSGYRALLSWVDAGAHLDRVGPSITRASATR